MIYLDTSVIISHMDEFDSNRSRAHDLLEILERNRVVSRLTLVELVSAYSRAGLNEPLALASYSLRRMGAGPPTRIFNKVLMQAFRL